MWQKTRGAPMVRGTRRNRSVRCHSRPCTSGNGPGNCNRAGIARRRLSTPSLRRMRPQSSRSAPSLQWRLVRPWPSSQWTGTLSLSLPSPWKGSRCWRSFELSPYSLSWPGPDPCHTDSGAPTFRPPGRPRPASPSTPGNRVASAPSGERALWQPPGRRVVGGAPARTSANEWPLHDHQGQGRD